MKKQLLIIAVCLSSTSAFAALDTQYANQLLKMDDQQSFKHWTVSGKVMTLNNKVPSAFGKLQLGYEVSMQYSLNSHLYASADVAYGRHHTIGWGATIGLQSSSGVFRPYVEGLYAATPRERQKWLYRIGYDAGVNVAFVKWLTPYVEFDNFLQKDREAFSTGISVPITDRISVQAGYEWVVQNKYDSANIKVSYAF